MMNRMLNILINYISNSEKTAITSLASATLGQVAAIESVNTALQRGAWIVAILAGILTMINLFYPLRRWYDKRNVNNRLDKGQ